MLMIQSCGNNPTAPQQTPAKQLLSRLETLRQKGVMFGHQDDPMYGLTWAYDKDSSDVKNVCGDYPAVMGFDLGGIEIADKANLDSVPFTRITEEIKNHHRRGGIITISWHPRNPQTTIEGGGRAGQKFPEGTAWDVTDTMIVPKILPGGSLNGVFNTWMQRLSKNPHRRQRQQNPRHLPSVARKLRLVVLVGRKILHSRPIPRSLEYAPRQTKSRRTQQSRLVVFARYGA